MVRGLSLASGIALAGFGCGGSTSGVGEPESEPRFVAVGADGAIVTSRDGTAWSPVASPVAVALTSIAAGDAALVAVGAGGTILSSSNGVSWHERSSGTTVDLSHVIFTGREFVAVGASWSSGATTLKSADAVAWLPVESPSTYMFHAVAHVGATLVAAAYFRSDLQTPALFTAEVSAGSAIPSGWSQREGPDFYDSVTVDGAISVVGGSAVSSSRDGIAWTTQQLPGGLPSTSIAASPSSFVVTTERGEILGSDDHACSGETCWTERAAPPGTTPWLGVTHGAAAFAAVGEEGAIATSPDGWAWSVQSSGTTKRLHDIAYGPAPLRQ